MIWYDATDKDLLPTIAKVGLKAGTYLASNEDVVLYYAETIDDDDGEYVILAIDMDQLDSAEAEPDYAGIEEPLSHTLGIAEDKIHEAWDASPQGWEDSLAIVGSLRYMATIRPGFISVVPKFYEELSSARLTKLSHYLDRGSSLALG